MDVYKKPEHPDEDVAARLGPLASLVGTWEGDQGVDVAPSAGGQVETRYRERIVFDPVGPVVNGPQVLYGLRYATTAWPVGEANPFHEEVGYWLWDSAAGLVLRCFIVPRGVTVLAGGAAAPDAREFRMQAEVGSQTFGILSSPFLDEAFKTVRYEVTVRVGDDGTFSYEEDSVLKIHGEADLFHHTDRNTLRL